MLTTIPFRKKDSFQILQELVSVATPQKLQKIKPIISYNKQEKLHILYEGVRLKKWKSEADAIHSIYGKQVSTNAFAKLKSDLSEKLFSDILQINVSSSDFPAAKRALRDCMLKYHSALLMYGFTPYHRAPDSILEKIFPKCVKYEFTELIIAIADILSWKHKLQGDMNRGTYYEQILERYLRIQECECRGKIFLGNIYAYYACSKSFKAEIAQQSINYLRALNDIKLSNETQKTMYFKRMLEVICHMSQFNYQKTAALCEETILYFESRAFIIPSMLRAFYFQAIASYTYLRDTKRGYQLLQKCSALMAGEGSINWFKLQELAVVMAFYAEDYPRANQIYDETTAHERFSKQPKHLIEYWKLVEAMLYITDSAGLWTASRERPFQIRFTSLSNNIPRLIRDKKGLNFAVHLIRFYLIVQKDNIQSRQNYEDCLEQLGNYVNRHCKGQAMQRARWIYLLLCQVSKHHFAKKAILDSPDTIILLQNLQQTPYDITDVNLEIEVIPFDHFFNIICSKLR